MASGLDFGRRWGLNSLSELTSRIEPSQLVARW